jgi:hypothetical protein
MLAERRVQSNACLKHVVRPIMRIVLCLAVAAIFATGCVTNIPNPNYAELSSLPTPTSWKLGIPWKLTVFNRRYRPMGTMTIVFTDEDAESCVGGSWRRVKVLDYDPSIERAAYVKGEHYSYQLVGQYLSIGLNEICDDYFDMSGQLSESRFEGTIGGDTLLSHTRDGFVQGVPLDKK